MRRRRSLLGTAARTAVIAGTATKVSGNVARRQEEAAARSKGRAARANGDHIARLERLNDLKKSGALTNREFEREKAKLLAD